MSMSPPDLNRHSMVGATLRRFRDAAETMRRRPAPDPDTIGPVLPEMRALFDRLRPAGSLDLVAAPGEADSLRLFSYRVRVAVDAPCLRFQVTSAGHELLRFLGQPAPGFEVLQVQQAGFQFHWRSDLARAFDEQAAILGAFCAFAPQGELVLEHLAVPVIRRHRVREVRGWIALGRDLTDDLFGPDSLSTVRRPLRSRIVRLPQRLLHPGGAAWPVAETVADLHVRWRRFGQAKRSR